MAKSKAKRAAAFAKPATGQFAAGALSNVNANAGAAGSYATSPAAAPSPNQLITINGQSGQLVQQPTNTPQASDAAKVAAIGSQTAGMTAKMEMIKSAEVQSAQAQNAPQTGFLGSNVPMAQAQQTAGQLPMTMNAPPAGEPQTPTAQAQTLPPKGGLMGLAEQVSQEMYAARWQTLPIGGGLKTVNLLKAGTTGTAKTAAGTAARFVANSKTAKISTSLIARMVNEIVLMVKNRPLRTLMSAGGTIAFSAWFVQEVGSTYPFAEFQKNNALQTLNFAFQTAQKKNDIAGMQDAIDLHNEITNPLLDSLASKMPFLNSQHASKDLKKALQLQMAINQRTVEIRQEMLTTGQPEFAIVAQKEAMDYKANQDYYNSERMKLVEWEIAARQAGNETYNANREASQERINQGKERSEGNILAARQAAAEESAEFWAAQRALQAQYEEEERLKIAQFWLDYKKQQQKMNDENRASKLGFGLIR